MNDNTAFNDIEYLKLVLGGGKPEDFLNNFKRFADFFPALVYVYDKGKNRIGYFNKQFTDLLGYDAKDFSDLSINWANLIFKDDEEKFNADLKKNL